MRAVERGSASVDWIAAIAIAAAMMAGLIVVGRHQIPRRPPVDPVRALKTLVAPPPRAVVPHPSVVRPRRQRTSPSRPRKTRPPRPQADAPTWVWR